MYYVSWPYVGCYKLLPLSVDSLSSLMAMWAYSLRLCVVGGVTYCHGGGAHLYTKCHGCTQHYLG